MYVQPSGDWTALQLCAIAGDTTATALLLGCGADPNVGGLTLTGAGTGTAAGGPRRGNATPLMMACRFGREGVAASLLAYGADTRVADEVGCCQLCMKLLPVRRCGNLCPNVTHTFFII